MIGTVRETQIQPKPEALHIKIAKKQVTLSGLSDLVQIAEF